MNKKIIIITLSVIIGLIAILLCALVVAESTNKKETMVLSQDDDTTSPIIPTENTTDNIVKNEVPTSNIEGEITEVETSDGGKIPVPPTFTYVEGESQKGAIIKDEDGNEFVWVPVESYNNYYRQLFLHSFVTLNVDTSAETLDTLGIVENEAYNKNYNDSIRNYGGFYIARYEAGRSDKNTVISKPDSLVWTGIVWEEAKKKSEEMYPENNYFQSDLINSYAWDTICIWLRDSGYDIDDSTSYGNYKNSLEAQSRVTHSASNPNWITNNIYDLAGNAWELTTEEYGDYYIHHIARGGGYWNEGSVYPISVRETHDDTAMLEMGFRVVLYLK